MSASFPPFENAIDSSSKAPQSFALDEDVSTLSGSGNSASGALVAVPQGGSALDAALKVYEERGIRAFFEGAKERVLYWSVAISIFLSVYCSLRRYAMDIM